MNEKTLNKPAGIAAAPEPGAIERVLQQVDISKSVFFIPEQYGHVLKVAQGISASDIIPSHYQGKPQNCFIALVRADSLGINVFFFMEHTYVVKGKLGLDGQLLIALMDKSGIFKYRISFFYSGETKETRKCRAIGILKDSGQEVSVEVSYQMAKENGWTDPDPVYEWTNGVKEQVGTKPTKWDTLTDQMLAYRSAAFLCRQYCPDVVGGMHTVDELRDIKDTEPEETERAPLFARPGVPVTPAPVIKTEPAKLQEAKAEVPKPEQPKPEEAKPVPPAEGDLFPKTTNPKIQAIIDRLIEDKADRNKFNEYLACKKLLEPGLDVVLLNTETTERIHKGLGLAMSDFRAWLKKQGKTA